MSGHRYERVVANDDDNDDHLEHSLQTSVSTIAPQKQQTPPTSPPPSFRSRTSSFAHYTAASDRTPLVHDTDRTLQDTFDSPSDDDSDAEDVTPGAQRRLDERQRVMSGRPSVAEGATETTGMLSGNDSAERPAVERRVTQLPVFPPATRTGRIYGGGNTDGVFANMSAKPVAGEEVDEKPPTYEQAAADAAPPYWENTIFAPNSPHSDDVYIDGLPVGSVFSFIWNAMISMSFQLVGFLLTYLLHTTHAAKNGSKAGLGITLIQYGFTLKGAGGSFGGGDGGSMGNGSFIPPPNDPNSHDFDPNAPVQPGDAGAGNGMPGFDAGVPQSGFGAMQTSDWFAYALMIVGWFVLIKAGSEYYKARRHEQVVLASPARGLTTPVVAEGEATETVV